MSISLKEKTGDMKFIERRAYRRIPTNIDARFFYGNLFYTGTLLNISEKGMFINTKRYITSESMLVVIISVENELLKIIATVKRSVRNNSDCDGMGVEVLRPSGGYVEFVKGLKITP
jgi:c-di-GMP-binding flagellar brake protein YcgR